MAPSDNVKQQIGVKMEQQTAKQEALLGTAIMFPEVIDEIRTEVFERDFIGWRGIVFWSILAIVDEGTPLNLISLTDHIKESGSMREIPNGYVAIASLTSNAQHPGAARSLALSIRREAARQLLTKEIEETLRELKNGERVEDSIEYLRSAIAMIDSGGDAYRLIGDFTPEFVDQVKERERLNTDIIGIETGLKQLDHFTLGFQPSELVIISARASIGKTALALSIAAHTSKAIPTGFISLEMSITALMRRLLAMWSGIDSRRITTGQIRPDWLIFDGAVEEAKRRRLYVMDRPNAKLSDVESTIRKMVRKTGVRIVFVDYVGLISLEGARKKHEQIDEVVRRLKQLSRDLEIPIVALAQLNRDSEGKEPSLANIKDSGAYEEHGDVVIFLQRDRVDQMGNDRPVPAKLIVAKNRNGETGVARLLFHQRLTLFEDHNYWDGIECDTNFVDLT
jgi:replicative DNA helicase